MAEWTKQRIYFRLQPHHIWVQFPAILMLSNKLINNYYIIYSIIHQLINYLFNSFGAGVGAGRDLFVITNFDTTDKKYGQKYLNAKLKILKNRKNSGRGPRAPKGREGKPEFYRFLFSQLCIERFFDSTIQRNSTLSNPTVGGQFYCPPCIASRYQSVTGMDWVKTKTMLITGEPTYKGTADTKCKRQYRKCKSY